VSAYEQARHMNEAIFLAAQREVADAIGRAVALADGDPGRALTELLAWVAAGGRARQLLLFQSTRYLLPDDLPHLDALVDEVVVAGADACEVLEELRNENPDLSERLDQELGAAAESAIVSWVVAECRAWREEHAP
jgi:hypothetical protein